MEAKKPKVYNYNKLPTLKLFGKTWHARGGNRTPDHRSSVNDKLPNNSQPYIV